MKYVGTLLYYIFKKIKLSEVRYFWQNIGIKWVWSCDFVMNTCLKYFVVL